MNAGRGSAPAGGAGQGPDPRPHVPRGVAVGVLLAAAAAVVGAEWLPSRTLAYGDLVVYFPSLYHGVGTTWDPYVHAGTPLLSNPQSGFWYPPARLLGGDFSVGLPYFLYLHLVIAALGTWAWLRTSLGDTPGPLVAGVVYAACGPTASLQVQPDKLPGHALLPFALLGLTLTLTGRGRARGWGFVLMAGAVAGTWVAGSVESALIAGLSLPLWAAFLPGAADGGPARRLARAGVAVLGLAVGTVLGACTLVPFALFLPESNRAAGLPIARIVERSTWPVDLLGWWAPNPFWSGEDLQYQAGAAAEARPRYLRGLYGGAMSVPLLFAATAAGRGAGLRLSAGLCALFVALALGENNPAYPWLLDHLPGFGTVRYPEKWWLGTVPVQAWLAGWGADAALRGGRGARRFGVGAVVSGIAALGLALAPDGSPHALAGAAARSALPFAAVGAASVAWMGLRTPGGLPASLLVAATTIDLLGAAAALFPYASPADVHGEAALARAVHAAWKGPGVPRLWAESLHVSNVTPGGPDPAARCEALRAAGHPESAVPHGVGYAVGMRVIGTDRHQLFTADLDEIPLAARRKLLQALGADFWVVYRHDEALALAREGGLIPVPAAPGSPLPVGLLREPDPLGRLRWVPEAVRAGEVRAAAQAMLERDARRAVLLIDGDPGAEGLAALPEASAEPAGAPPEGTVRAANPEPGLWVAEVVAPVPGALVLQEGWAPGWEVSVDGGRYRPAARVDFLMVGSPVGAGRHRVVLRYRAAGARAGAGVSALGALLLVGVARRLARSGPALTP